jgi:hypothetical protein
LVRVLSYNFLTIEDASMMITTKSGRTLQLKSYGKMLVISLFVVSGAWLAAYSFNTYYPLPAIAASILEYSGYILWGTGLARPKVDALTHCIPSKIFYRKLQFLCSELGIFAFVFASSLETAL